jgi:hypothetical protein
VLHVRVAANGQAETTLEASPLQDLAAIGRLHTTAKAVHTHAPPDAGLIGSFGCHSLTSKKRIKTPNAG